MRVNVRTARKHQGNCGKCGDELLPGSEYRSWSFRYGGKHVRCMKLECAPRQSDLTQSKLSQVYAALEGLQDSIPALDAEKPDLDEVEALVEDAVASIREVASEYEEAAEPFGGQGENMERSEACEALADELEAVSIPDPDDFEDDDDPGESWKSAVAEEFSGIDYEG